VIEDEISHHLLISSTGINFSNGVVMKKIGRPTSQENRLPLAQIRKAACRKQLMLDLSRKNNQEPKGSLAWIHEQLEKEEWSQLSNKSGLIEAPSYERLRSWFGDRQKNVFPDKSALNSFNALFPDCYHWLVPGNKGSMTQKLITAIDLCLIGDSEEGSKQNFKQSDQRAFVLSEFRRIYSRWVLGQAPTEGDVFDLTDEELLGVSKRPLENYKPSKIAPESVSSSLLYTHGASALPFHLLSIADYGKVSEGDVLEWIGDLLISALLISSLSVSEKKNISLKYESQGWGEEVIERLEFDPFGSSPALIRLLCGFCSLTSFFGLPTKFQWEYDDGVILGLHNVNKVKNQLLRGFVELDQSFKHLGVDWGVVIDVVSIHYFSEPVGKANLLATVEQARRELPYLKPVALEPDLFADINKDRIIKEIYYELTHNKGGQAIYRRQNNFSTLLASAESIKPADAGRYSWGYFGKGAQAMAKTVLGDFCKGAFLAGGYTTAFNYRIGSVFLGGFEYVVSASQIKSFLSMEFIDDELEETLVCEDGLLKSKLL